MTAPTIALRLSSVLWFIWGGVHLLAGVLTISNPTAQAVAAIADAVPAGAMEMDYHDAVGAILNQHGWNLAWGGVVTMVAAAFIWKGDARAIALAALVGGLLDLGYFMFLDLGGFVHFVPGTVMTIFSASAILLSAYGHYALRQR